MTDAMLRTRCDLAGGDGRESQMSEKDEVTDKASSGKVEGRRLYLSEGVHFRLRLYAYQRGQKLSDAAEELLDRALPRLRIVADDDGEPVQ
jgi:hypothetical protein